MKKTAVVFLLVIVGLVVYAQTDDMKLALQFIQNGEPQKALDIYSKLYRQDNESYYSYYNNLLINLKKFDDAESANKKMMRKHPGDLQYTITLGRIYREKGAIDKSEEIYNGIIKSLPPDQGMIAGIATQFYQLENLDYSIRIFQQGRKILHDDHLFANELISLYRYKHDKVNVVTEYLNLLLANPEYIFQAKSTFSTLFEGADDYNMLKSVLLKLIQQNPQQTVLADLLSWQYLQQKQFDQALTQAIALSRRLNDGGNSIFDLCRTLVSNQAYDEAIRGYEFILNGTKNRELFIPAKVEMINTKNLKITSGNYNQADLLDLEKNYGDLLAEFGRNANTAFAMQKLAKLEAFKLHHTAEAQKILEQLIAINGIDPFLLAECKLDLGDVYLLNNKPWDATLIYNQVEKDFPESAIGQDAAYRDAKLAYYTGDFNWARGQLNVLKAATSQLIANDALNLSLQIIDHTAFDSVGNALKMYARADLLIFKEEPNKASIILDSIAGVYPGNTLGADILMAKARISVQKNDFKAAVMPLQKIVDSYPTSLWADDAVYMLGDIYENHLGDKNRAQPYYQKIITDYPGSLLLNDARKHFRTIRGDLPPGP